MAAKALWVITTLAVFLVSSVAQAQSPLLYDEAEAQAIDRSLMCPVCPAQTIDQTQVEVARQMRQKVRELLAEGKSRQEVLDYFEARYGPGILAAPPRTGFTLVAWLVPPVVLLLALAGGFLVLRAMRGKPAPAAAPAEPEGDLEPYLAAVEEQLSHPAAGEPPARRNQPPGQASTSADGT